MKLVINQPKAVVKNTLTNIVETLRQMTGIAVQVSKIAQNQQNEAFTDLVFYGINSNTGKFGNEFIFYFEMFHVQLLFEYGYGC